MKSPGRKLAHINVLHSERTGLLEEITYGVVCANARFVFDKPVILLKQNYIELTKRPILVAQRDI